MSQNESKVRLLQMITSINYFNNERSLLGKLTFTPQNQRTLFQKSDEIECNCAISFIYFPRKVRVQNISCEDFHI